MNTNNITDDDKMNLFSEFSTILFFLLILTYLHIVPNIIFKYF
jgi:hypothetical protein